jgi:hypothetical protein
MPSHSFPSVSFCLRLLLLTHLLPFSFRFMALSRAISGTSGAFFALYFTFFRFSTAFCANSGAFEHCLWRF